MKNGGTKAWNVEPVEIVISEYCNEAIDIPINSLNRNARAVTFAVRLNETGKVSVFRAVPSLFIIYIYK